jgi:hypothetical protein
MPHQGDLDKPTSGAMEVALVSHNLYDGVGEGMLEAYFTGSRGHSK